MPFTPTHVLAILPISLSCRRLSVVALAIGSIIPDFTMFFHLSTYQFSHSILGLFFYCLPAGFFVYLLFIHLGKQFLVDISPPWIYSRVANYRNVYVPYTIANVFLISLALFIGALTHVVWDSFSHSYGWGLKVFPFLESAVNIFGVEIPFYKIVQYGSSIVGLPILLAYCLYVVRRLKSVEVENRKNYSQLKLILVIVSFMVIPLVIIGYRLQPKSELYSVVGSTIIDSISASIVLFFTYSITHRLFRSGR